MNSDGTPVTHEQYLAILEAQGHKCAICGKHVNGDGHLDHNHQTGAPRGILCSQCNLALGWLEPHLGYVAAYLQLATGEAEGGPCTGITREEFLQGFADALKPGGYDRFTQFQVGEQAD